MALQTSQATAELLRGLTIQMQNKTLSKSEAKRLAIMALQEVVESEGEEPQVEENIEDTPQEETPQEETPEEEKPTQRPASAVDPKTKLLTLMTRLQETVQASLKKLENEVTLILKETAGAAVPLGDFSIGNDDSSAKVTIEQGENPAEAKVSYTLKREWAVPDVQMPITGSAPRSCNLPLRHEVLELCGEVSEHTGSELAWKRKQKETGDQITRLETLAKSTGDYRVTDVLKNRPEGNQAENWKKWAQAGQVFLLGSDYVDGKGFSSIRGM
jgi:hypothetical protein